MFFIVFFVVFVEVVVILFKEIGNFKLEIVKFVNKIDLLGMLFVIIKVDSFSKGSLFLVKVLFFVFFVLSNIGKLIVFYDGIFFVNFSCSFV